MTSMRTVGILLFNEVEVLDFAGPFEVFSLAANATSDKYFKVITIAEHHAPISARNGLRVVPDYSFSNHPDIDVLVVPGPFLKFVYFVVIYCSLQFDCKSICAKYVLAT